MTKKSNKRKVISAKKIAITAFFVTLTFVATAYLQIKMPHGYIHVGDAVILVACYFLPLPYSILASIIGASFADLASGYAQYIPVTIIAKGLLVLISWYPIYNNKFKKWYGIPLILLANLIAALIYTAYDGIQFGKGAAISNLTFGLIQPAAAIVLSFTLVGIFSSIKELISFKESINPKKFVHKSIAEEAMNIQQNIDAENASVNYDDRDALDKLKSESESCNSLSSSNNAEPSENE